MAAAAIPRNIGTGDWSAAPEVWEGICSALVQYKRLFVFADFDGTLSQLVEVPSKAVLDPDAEWALRRLSAEPRVSVAVISGRSVDDVAGRIGLPIMYAGDYGLEIHAPDVQFTVPEADSVRRKLPELCNRIREGIQHVPGALVEAKHLTASVHFRQVDSDLVPGLLDLVRNCVAGTAFEVRRGKCAFEVRPRVDWTTGDAVSWMLRRNSAVPEQAICFGDDETDEDMFRQVSGAVRIRVTDGQTISTAAPYCVLRDDLGRVLNGIADVAEAICCR
jgi:trehalose 6-phosphate phosphatase